MQPLRTQNVHARDANGVSPKCMFPLQRFFCNKLFVIRAEFIPSSCSGACFGWFVKQVSSIHPVVTFMIHNFSPCAWFLSWVVFFGPRSEGRGIGGHHSEISRCLSANVRSAQGEGTQPKSTPYFSIMPRVCRGWVN